MLSSFSKTVFVFSPGNRAVCKALNRQRHPRGQLRFIKVATEKDRHLFNKQEELGTVPFICFYLFRTSGISDAPMKLWPELSFIKIRRQKLNSWCYMWIQQRFTNMQRTQQTSAVPTLIVEEHIRFKEQKIPHQVCKNPFPPLNSAAFGDSVNWNTAESFINFLKLQPSYWGK